MTWEWVSVKEIRWWSSNLPNPRVNWLTWHLRRTSWMDFVSISLRRVSLGPSISSIARVKAQLRYRKKVIGRKGKYNEVRRMEWDGWVETDRVRQMEFVTRGGKGGESPKENRQPTPSFPPPSFLPSRSLPSSNPLPAIQNKHETLTLTFHSLRAKTTNWFKEICANSQLRRILFLWNSTHEKKICMGLSAVRN